VGAEQISTNDLRMTFNSAEAFMGILQQIDFKVPKSSEGVHTPTEIVNVARDTLICVFKTIIDDMARPEVQKHLECSLIAMSGLSKMINKKLLHTETSKDIH
jgi:hypothetical protein